MKKEFDIEDLSVENAIMKPSSKESIAVTLDGISGSDFVACCKDSLLQEIILAAGEEYCLELFEIDVN